MGKGSRLGKEEGKGSVDNAYKLCYLITHLMRS
jgi:hypothetical protein